MRRNLLVILICQTFVLSISPLWAANFNYTINNPESEDAQTYLIETSNIEIRREPPVIYYHPAVGAETESETPPGTLIYHFPFTEPIAGGSLYLTTHAFHWNYSKGHTEVFLSTDGEKWEKMAEALPPEYGGVSYGHLSGDLPSMLIGAQDIYIKIKMYSYGSSASKGSVWTNTAQHLRYDTEKKSRAFQLEVMFDSKSNDELPVSEPTYQSACYSIFDEGRGVIVVPHLQLDNDSFWLELSPVNLSPFQCQLTNLGLGGSGEPCATFNLDHNLLLLHPVLIGSDLYNLNFQVVSTDPFTMELVDIELAEGDQILFDGTVIFDTIISQSTSDQWIEAPDIGIRLSIPSETIENENSLRLTEIKNQEFPFEHAEWGKMLDINLGEKTTLKSPVVIEFPLDMNQLPNDVVASNIHVTHWREDVQSWEFWPKTVDFERGVVAVETDRLSPWAWFASLDDHSIASPKKYFTINFDTDLNPSEYGYSKDNIEAFALQVGNDLDTAFEEYKALGFTMPDTPHNVTIFEPNKTITSIKNEYLQTAASYMHTSDPHYASGWIGDDTIYFALKNQNQMNSVQSDDQVRHDAAHEFFHSVQNQYLNSFSMGQRKWFIEATADFAAFQYVGNRSGRGLATLNTRFFSDSLTTTDGAHEYQAAHFIDYLVQNMGVDFKSLWQAVADSYVTPTLDIINQFLRDKTGSWLSEHWDDFAVYAFTGTHQMFSNSPNSGNGFPLSERSSQLTIFGNDDQQEKHWICQLPKELSAGSWGIRPVTPDDKETMTLVIQPTSDIPDDVTLHIFRVQDYKTSAVLESLAVFDEYDKRPSIESDVTDDDILFVVVTYTDTLITSGNKTIHLRVKEKSDLKVRLPERLAVMKNSPLTITPEVTGGVPPYTYEWKLEGNFVGSQKALEVTFQQIASESPASIELTVQDAENNRVTESLVVTASEDLIIEFEDKAGYHIRLSLKDLSEENHEWVTETEYTRTFDVFEVTLPQFPAGYHVGPVPVKVEVLDSGISTWYMKASHSLGSGYGMATPNDEGYYGFQSDYYYLVKIFPEDESRSISLTYLHIKAPSRQ